MKQIYVFDRDQGNSYGRNWSSLVGDEFQFVQFSPSNDRNQPSSLAVNDGTFSNPFVLVIHGPRNQDDPVVKAALRLAEANAESRVIVVGGTKLSGIDGPQIYFRKAVVLNGSRETPDPSFAKCFSNFMDGWNASGVPDWQRLEPVMRIPEELAALALWQEAESLGLTRGKPLPEELRNLSATEIGATYARMDPPSCGKNNLEAIALLHTSSREQIQKLKPFVVNGQGPVAAVLKLVFGDSTTDSSCHGDPESSTVFIVENRDTTIDTIVRDHRLIWQSGIKKAAWCFLMSEQSSADLLRRTNIFTGGEEGFPKGNTFGDFDYRYYRIACWSEGWSPIMQALDGIEKIDVRIWKREYLKYDVSGKLRNALLAPDSCALEAEFRKILVESRIWLWEPFCPKRDDMFGDAHQMANELRKWSTSQSITIDLERARQLVSRLL